MFSYQKPANAIDIITKVLIIIIINIPSIKLPEFTVPYPGSLAKCLPSAWCQVAQKATQATLALTIVAAVLLPISKTFAIKIITHPQH